MRERNIRIALVVVDLFAAVSAVAGAVGLATGGINIPLSVLHGTAFANFTVPALLLGIVVGGSALAAAAIALFGSRRLAVLEPWRFDALASVASGGIMVGWITIEVVLIGLGSWLQPAYFVVGLVMIGLAGLLQWAETHPTEHEIAVSGRQRARGLNGSSAATRASRDHGRSRPAPAGRAAPQKRHLAMIAKAVVQEVSASSLNHRPPRDS